MRVLFLHPRFPGPFRPLAACFGAMADTKVLFIAERHRREVAIPGVRRLLVAPPGPVASAGTNSAEREILFALRRGANMANAMLKLQRDGFQPDIVCYSSGSGCGFYAADIFPRAFRTVHADWFQNKGPSYTFFNQGEDRSPEEFAPWRIRNLCQFNALTDCQLAVTPTLWQKTQFPEPLNAKIHVLPQGVDTDFFSPLPDETFPLDNGQVFRELVTFTGRSLEPHRGFPQFARSLPRLLAARPDCHVMIMAAGRPGETDAAPPPELQALCAAHADRVHYLGFRPYEEYRRLLRASSVHIYLTAPVALSAGLLEALSCGCMVLGSDTEPVREVIRHGENGVLCDFHNPDNIADIAANLLQLAESGSPAIRYMRDTARQSILDNYDSRPLGAQYLKLLLDNFENRP